MNYPDKWEYHIEFLNITSVIYNPIYFTPIYKLSNGESYDLEGLHTKVYQFFPNLYNKVNFLWVANNGNINGLHRTSFEEMVDMV